ncbi:MAG: hypothetical protein PHF63_00995 [Herbinix sp.]|nr:hypothetical protein [Herbinix sp.]
MVKLKILFHLKSGKTLVEVEELDDENVETRVDAIKRVYSRYVSNNSVISTIIKFGESYISIDNIEAISIIINPTNDEIKSYFDLNETIDDLIKK